MASLPSPPNPESVSGHARRVLGHPTMSKEPCPKCQGATRWVGRSAIILRRKPQYQSRDVVECAACGYTWRYGRNGRLGCKAFVRV